jgi:hypothetical protein
MYLVERGASISAVYERILRKEHICYLINKMTEGSKLPDRELFGNYTKEYDECIKDRTYSSAAIKKYLSVEDVMNVAISYI